MTRIYVIDTDGAEREAHYFDHSRTEPDMFGKTVGYRVSPSGDNRNWSEVGVMYRSLEDAAEHLQKNKGWGIRVTMPDAPPSLRFKNIYVDGVPL